MCDGFGHENTQKINWKSSKGSRRAMPYNCARAVWKQVSHIQWLPPGGIPARNVWKKVAKGARIPQKIDKRDGRTLDREEGWKAVNLKSCCLDAWHKRHFFISHAGKRDRSNKHLHGLTSGTPVTYGDSRKALENASQMFVSMGK